MKLVLLSQLGIVLLCSTLGSGVPTDTTESTTAKQQQDNDALDHSYCEDILSSIDKQMNEWQTKQRTADWNYETNLTDKTLEEKMTVVGQVAAYKKQVRNQIEQLKWRDLKDENLKRQFCKLSFIGTNILPEESNKEPENILTRAERLYNTLTTCDHKETKCNLTLVELNAIMANSRDPEELKHVWTRWHNLCGRALLGKFPEYVDLLTEAAKLHNMSAYTEVWFKDYESKNLTDQIEVLWQQVKPLYVQLHAYVRNALKKQYGDLVSKDGLIPSHLLGDMWAMKWTNIANFSVPFPQKKPYDISEQMIAQGYTVEKMYREAEKFFVSMGMPKLPDTFWEKSIFTKPADRDIVCDSPPWDFNDGKTYLVSGCTNVSMDGFRTAHKNIGTLQYFMQYKDQRVAFKNAANPGLREAMGELVALSVMTASHLDKIGLLKANASDPEVEMNNLYMTALSKIANLPFAYTTEKWRWDVFQKKIKTSQYNCHWWKLSDDIQGVKPPMDRGNGEFDAGAEYHIAVDYTYLRYFVSTILQFQMHKALCIEMGEYKPNEENGKPLHMCDITSSTQAGNKLMSAMKLGSSKPWTEVFEIITGEKQMDASGLLEYFKPLHEWLKTKNTENKEFIGWTKSGKDCLK